MKISFQWKTKQKEMLELYKDANIYTVVVVIEFSTRISHQDCSSDEEHIFLYNIWQYF